MATRFKYLNALERHFNIWSSAVQFTAENSKAAFNHIIWLAVKYVEKELVRQSEVLGVAVASISISKVHGHHCKARILGRIQASHLKN